MRLPILIAGDFNGSPRGAVYNFARSQNYKSATEEFWRRGAGSLHSLDAAAVPAALPVSTQQNGIEQQVLKATVAAGPVVSGAAAGTAVGTGVHDFSSEFFDGISADKALAQQSQSEAAPSTSSTISTALTTSTTTQSIDATATNGAAGNTPQRNPQDEEVEAHVGVTTPSVGTWDRWISHRSHRGQNVPVDHIFFLNPSDQVCYHFSFSFLFPPCFPLNCDDNAAAVVIAAVVVAAAAVVVVVIMSWLWCNGGCTNIKRWKNACRPCQIGPILCSKN